MQLRLTERYYVNTLSGANRICCRKSEFYDVWLHVSVVRSERGHAIGREALLAYPLERLALQAFVEAYARGDHVAPRLRGITAVGEEQNVFPLFVQYL